VTAPWSRPGELIAGLDDHSDCGLAQWLWNWSMRLPGRLRRGLRRRDWGALRTAQRVELAAERGRWTASGRSPPYTGTEWGDRHDESGARNERCGRRVGGRAGHEHETRILGAHPGDAATRLACDARRPHLPRVDTAFLRRLVLRGILGRGRAHPLPVAGRRRHGGADRGEPVARVHFDPPPGYHPGRRRRHRRRRRQGLGPVRELLVATRKGAWLYHGDAAAPALARRWPAFPRPHHQPHGARSARRAHAAGGGEDRAPRSDDLPLDRPRPDLAGSEATAGFRARPTNGLAARASITPSG
jgi:hypothetical protein